MQCRAEPIHTKFKDKLLVLREASKTSFPIESSYDSQLPKSETKCVRTRHSAAVMEAKVFGCTGVLAQHGLAPGHWGVSVNACHRAA